MRKNLLCSIKNLRIKVYLVYLRHKLMNMRKLISALSIFLISFAGIAEEGMIIPSLLEAFESDMQAMGMKLSAKDIYDVNNSSLKDAIFHFGGGCTSEVVSDQGLMLTNHHCGYSQINVHSSLENNYLKYGFWAKTKADELPNPGLTAARMVRIDDVTKTVLEGTEGLTGSELDMKIKANIRAEIEKALVGNHYEAEIKAFDYGNSYYLLVKETFKDVRLVGAPPSTIGKFGGDTDNWVWPRHTGDFSVFRIYADANNMPSDYSENNKPYKPLHHLPVSLQDRKQGDFTMVFGFPGSTAQHTVSDELAFLINKERPARINMRRLSLSVIDAGMALSEETTLQYASKQSRISNAYKKWIGQLGGLKVNEAVKVKIAEEKRYNDMAMTKPEWKEKYGNVLPELNRIAREEEDGQFAYSMFIEYVYVGAEVFDLVRNAEKLTSKYEELNAAGNWGVEVDKYLASADNYFKNYDVSIDKKIFMLQSEEYIKQLDLKFLPSMMQENNACELTELIYNKSIFTNKDDYKSFLMKFNGKSEAKLKKDPAFRLYLELMENFQNYTRPLMAANYFQKEQLMKTYVAGKYEMFPDDKHWADANSTLRITYGKLEGSAPTDGMTYTEHTTLDGLMAKHNTGNPDFDILPRMKELYDAKDYGEYAQDGELWVCFTGSNHTTGGNSGSPTISAEGYLMGLNFDRTWESTMSDYMFDASRCRNITVDIRYVMWVMDKYAGAKHLVDEMTIIRD